MQVITLSDLECDYLNARQCCTKLNIWVIPKLIAHAVLIPAFLFYGYWLLALINLPILGWMTFEFLTVPSGNTGVFDPTEIYNRGQLKRHMRQCMIFLGWYLISFFIYMYWKRGVAPGNWKRVLLVIAHPDDECMFFGPTLVEVVRRGGKVYVVCLSSGEQGGTGDVRKRELFAACSALGVPQADVVVYRCCDLADGPHNSWSPLLVARLVSHHAHVRSADVLLTFDRYGVSYHENHVSAWRGVVLAVRNALCPEHSQAYALETVNILRKYSVFFDCFLSRCTSNIIFIASLDDHSKIVKAMSTGHPSQYIWFRRLFMYFSRYAYINTYKRIIGK
ncbi:hypothetical protein AAG570_007003 [Ranatra chinensis]|uniref:N-acetylglucosaminylphosphatidylinositol deacetylase n=1 Tax=Ranatra chinensis TaxID=642074 RepID=A0ABD0YVQ3_9HEMI